MAKNKRELQENLEAANKRIAELSQSNQIANSNINNDGPSFWLKTFFKGTVVNAKTSTRTECRKSETNAA